MRMGFRALAALLPVAAVSLAAQTVCPPVPAYSPCQIIFEIAAAGLARYPNPYTGVELRAEFRSPRHRTYLMSGFWDGGSRWVIRFAPTEPGEWDFRVSSNVVGYDGKTGTFTALESDSPGFVRTANVHHFAYTESLKPHLWMGAAVDRFAQMDPDTFHKIVDARAGEHFNHISGSVLGGPDDGLRAFPAPDRPDPGYFRRLDEWIRYMNLKGITADLELAASAGQLAKLFPTWQERERYLRYLVARYAAFHITWHGIPAFEEFPDGRDLLRETGLLLKRIDPYQHLRSSATRATSAALADDGWMDYVTHNSAEPALGAIEHQLYALPFVNAGFAGGGGAGFRRGLWNAAMNGQYVAAADGTAAALPEMKAFFEFFAATRHWELEPYFDVDGGRALALEDVEYILYVDNPGPVEVSVEKHGYDVAWFSPASGERLKQKDYKGEHFTGEPPDQAHDWVLHISRESRKESMLRSYKFDSRPILMQEIDLNPQKIPFDIAEPAGAAISLASPAAFAAKLKRETHATRSMLYLWTAEVPAESQGYRVLGTSGSGHFPIPAGIASRLPAGLHVRLAGMNANGKVYVQDRTYQLIR